MKVYFVNLHCNSFILKTRSAILVKKEVPTRHNVLICELLKRRVEIVNIVTRESSTLPDKKVFSKLKSSREYCLREAKYVLKKNNMSEVKSIISEPTVDKDDILIIYPHYGIQTLNYDRPWTVLVDFTHFYGYRKEAFWLLKLKPKAYFCEIDLGKYSALYKKYYGNIGMEYISRPFSFEKRFERLYDFKSRLNKVCAMGNIARLRTDIEAHRDYIRQYKQKVMQPMRKVIYDHKDELRAFLDCYSTIGVDTYRLMNQTESDYWLIKEFKWWWNYVIRERFPNYFRDFDMVETYNKYKLVVNAEDSNGIYAIGTIEAMACGCAFIGKRYGVYEELGFEDGVSYIAYDGSLDDLKKKAEYYLREENAELLEKIANNGYRIVHEKYSEIIIGDYYYNILSTISKEKSI